MSEVDEGASGWLPQEWMRLSDGASEGAVESSSGRFRRTNRRTEREEETDAHDEDRSRDTFGTPQRIGDDFGVCQPKTPQQVDTAGLKPCLDLCITFGYDVYREKACRIAEKAERMNI